MRLTKGQRRILEALKAGQELSRARPGGWWLGNHQVSGRLAWALMWACLISAKASTGGAVTYYRINEWGRQALADPEFVRPLPALGSGLGDEPMEVSNG